MKKYLGLMMMAGLALAPVQAQVKLSERLGKIANHLGEGGVHFSVTDTEDDLRDIGILADRLFELVPNNEMPPGLKFESLLGDLGLYSMQGRGSSSKRLGANWHNRTFLLTDGKHEGVLSLLGGESKTSAASSFAPAGADLVLETTLNLREVQGCFKKVGAAVGGRGEEEILSGFKEEVLDLGFSIADLFADFTVRGTMVLWLDEEKTFEMQPGMSLPVPHFAARLENAGMVWKMLESEVKELCNVVEQGDEVILTSKDGREQTPFGPVMPQIVWNSSTKELFVGLTPEDLAVCRGEGARITSSASYQKATEGFPKELSSLAYVSEDVFRLVEMLTKEMVPQLPEEAQGFIGQLLPYLEMLGEDGGYAAGVAVEKDGFLGVANLPFPLKGDSFIGPGGVGGIALLAGLATPAILKAKKSADKAKMTNNLKQTGMLLMHYQSDFGAYPKRLGDLLTKELIERDQWVAMEMDDVVYLPGADEADLPNRILAYREFPELNQVVFLRLDISVQSLPTPAFKALLRKQEK